MKKISLLAASFLLSFTFSSAYAGTSTSDPETTVLPQVETIPGYLKFDFLNIKMPNGDSRMGLLGAHYQINLLPIPDFYTGPAIYGAVSGDKGGVFLLGIDNDYRPALNRYFLLDAGVFLGSGGARSLPVSNGIVYVPHIGLDYRLNPKGALVNLSYSYDHFPGGNISGSQVMLGLLFPLDFADYSSASSQETFSLANSNDHYFVAPFYQSYLMNNAKTLNGGTVSNIGLPGLEVGKYFSSYFYWLAKASGAATGNANGYMDALGGIGLDYPITAKLHGLVDALIGAGGGGKIDTDGGVLLEADAGLGYSITPQFEPRVTAGYLTGGNNFKAKVINAALAYHFGLINQSAADPLLDGNQSYDLKHFSASLMNQTIFKATQQNISKRDIQLISIDLNQSITPHFFLDYRAASTYAGGSAGGPTEGAVGAGYQTMVNHSFMPYAAVMIGAIGGGAIDASGGLFYQPEVGMNYLFTKDLSAKAYYGRIISVKGALNSNTIGLGIAYHFGKLVAA